VDKRFLNAFTEPSRLKILGRFLYPFCLKHRVRLEAIESPLLKSGVQVQPLDLLIAIKICAEEDIGYITFFDSWRLAKLKSDKTYFIKTLKEFERYVFIKNWPKFWEKTKEGRSDVGVPWVLTVVTNLIQAGVSEERAWEMPECQAIWLSTSMMVSKGLDVQVLSTEEEELMEEIKNTEFKDKNSKID
jgi:hypothetical protein